MKGGSGLISRDAAKQELSELKRSVCSSKRLPDEMNSTNTVSGTLFFASLVKFGNWFFLRVLFSLSIGWWAAK